MKKSSTNPEDQITSKSLRSLESPIASSLMLKVRGIQLIVSSLKLKARRIMSWQSGKLLVIIYRNRNENVIYLAQNGGF